MTALDLTRDGLVRALSAAVARSAPVDAELRSRGEAIASRAQGQGLEARVVARGPGHVAVEVSGAGLFSRAFGGLDGPGDGIVDTLAVGD